MSDIDAAMYERLLNSSMSRDAVDALQRKSLISRRGLSMLLHVDDESFLELVELSRERSSEQTQIKVIIERVLDGKKCDAVDDMVGGGANFNRRSSIRSSINTKTRRVSLSQQLSSDLAFLENAMGGGTVVNEYVRNTSASPTKRRSIRLSIGSLFASSSSSSGSIATAINGEEAPTNNGEGPTPNIKSVQIGPPPPSSTSSLYLDDIIRDLCISANNGPTLCSKVSRLTGSFKHWTVSPFEFDRDTYGITYRNKDESIQRLWLDETVVVKKLFGTYFYRTNCLLIDWRRGSYFMLLSFETFVETNNFFRFLCEMMDVCKVSVLSEPKRFRVLRNLSLRSAMSSKQETLVKIRALDIQVMESSGLNLELYFVPENVLCCEDFTVGYPYSKYASGTTEALSHNFYISNYHRSSFVKLCNRFPDRHQEEICRFFKAKKFNVADAEEALARHMQWRLSNLPVEYSDVKGELDTGKCYCYGYDYDGCPIIHIHEGRLDVNNPLVANDELTIRGFIYRLEQAIGKIPNRDGKVTVVVNRVDADERHFNIRFLAEIVNIFRNNYPGRLSKAIVYPANGPGSNTDTDSAGSKKRLKLAKGLLNAGMLKKVKFLDNIDDFKMYIPADQLLLELGGRNMWNFQRHISKESSVMEPFLWTDPQMAVDYYPTGQFAIKRTVGAQGSTEGHSDDDDTHEFMACFGGDSD